MKKIMILLSIVMILISCNKQKIENIENKVEDRQNVSTGQSLKDDDNFINMSWSSSEDKNDLDENKSQEIEEESEDIEDENEQEQESNSKDDTSTTSIKITNTTDITTSKVKTFTLEEVAKHDKKEDCYTWIDWKVYDVTSFFGKHPWWDDNLLKLCWIDWTEMFNSVHAKNQKAIMVRDSLYVWDLK